MGNTHYPCFKCLHLFKSNELKIVTIHGHNVPVCNKCKEKLNKEKIVEFESFNKISRLSREIVITEKLDGTNAQLFITEDGEFLTGSRKRWVTPKDDNYGFSRWAHEHKDALMELGVGRHYGEWWGQGIQRKYGLTEKRFSLFNTHRWGEERPTCCDVVPVLYQGMFDTVKIDEVLADLAEHGSYASEGFMNPEGIVIFHTHGNLLFKKTIKDDGVPKSLIK